MANIPLTVDSEDDLFYPRSMIPGRIETADGKKAVVLDMEDIHGKRMVVVLTEAGARSLGDQLPRLFGENR